MMRKKASKTKTFKQQKIDQEEERIQKYLLGKDFKSVPIGQEPEEESQAYEFQNDKNDTFDTKEYLLEAMARDYGEGKKIDPKYEKQLREKGII